MTFCAEIERLRLFPGQILGITGQSGCGKSTLLELLALLIKPDHCDCHILRTPEHEYNIKSLLSSPYDNLSLLRRFEFGFVHQAGGLYPFLSCRENIELPLLLQCSPKKEIDDAVNDLLAFLALEVVADQPAEKLSYGERQRTAIARALIHTPSLILADEPTSALDPDSAYSAMRLLCEGATKRGASLLIVSHDHSLLKACDIPTCTMLSAPDSDKTKRHFLLNNTNENDSPSKKEIQSQKSVEKLKKYSKAGEKKKKSPCRLPFYLAWRDYFHEYAISLCAVLAFAAALTPIMVLGGLRNGVITTLTQRFLNAPGALAINPYGTKRYTDDDIANLAGLSDVAFIVPQTRTLASSVLIPREGRPNMVADVIPTKEGDPLLLRYASIPEENEAVITQELARSLSDARIGKDIDLAVTRRRSGKDERVFSRVRIVGILPDAADWKAHVYLPFSHLLDMEHYRDGYAVPSRKWEGETAIEMEKNYAGFRMYAKDPEAVLTIRDALKKLGIDAWTSAREVETIQGIKNALSLITLLVGGVTLVGMALSLASLAIGNVRRKARLTAQGHLMGLSRIQLVSVPLVQMAITSLLAATCSLIFYALVAHLLHFAASPWLEQGESATQLEVTHVFLLYAGSFLLSCLCGLTASVSLLSLQPAEVLRREN